MLFFEKKKESKTVWKNSSVRILVRWTELKDRNVKQHFLVFAKILLH